MQGTRSTAGRGRGRGRARRGGHYGCLRLPSLGRAVHSSASNGVDRCESVKNNNALLSSFVIPALRTAALPSATVYSTAELMPALRFHQVALPVHQARQPTSSHACTARTRTSCRPSSIWLAYTRKWMREYRSGWKLSKCRPTSRTALVPLPPEPTDQTPAKDRCTAKRCAASSVHCSGCAVNDFAKVRQKAHKALCSSIFHYPQSIDYTLQHADRRRCHRPSPMLSRSVVC